MMSNRHGHGIQSAMSRRRHFVFVFLSSFLGPASSFSLLRRTATMPRRSRLSRPSPALSAKQSAGTQFVTNKRCPYAQKAWIALEAGECAYEMREVSLYGTGGKPGWFWELNPKGTVPIVATKDDGSGAEVFADSELILDAVGDGSIGGNEGILASSRELSAEESARVGEWRSTISNRLVPVGKSAVLGGSLPNLRTLLRELNRMVVGPYLAGERMTLADCAAFPFLWRIDQEFGIGRDDDEGKLRAWLDFCMDTTPIKRTIPVQGWWWWW